MKRMIKVANVDVKFSFFFPKLSKIILKNIHHWIVLATQLQSVKKTIKIKLSKDHLPWFKNIHFLCNISLFCLEGELDVSGDGLNPVSEHSYASPGRRPPSSRDNSRPGNFIIRYLNNRNHLFYKAWQFSVYK